MSELVVDAMRNTWIHVHVRVPGPDTPAWLASLRATIRVSRNSDGVAIVEANEAPMSLVTISSGLEVAHSQVGFMVCSDLTKNGTELQLDVTVTADWFTVGRTYYMTIDCMGDAACLAVCS